jgi:hypothetical protein
MKQAFQVLVLIPFLVLCYQMYSYSASRTGTQKQSSCQLLGIVYMTAGTVALVSRSPLLAFTGIILIMAGFRLLAKGLDRINKKTFIDRYHDDL